MFQKVSKIIKWVSLPVLLIASMFSGFAAGYKLLLDTAFCLGAVVLVLHALRMKEYFWASGFVAIVVLFSPLLLTVKIFLLLATTCLATVLAVLAAFRRQPVPTR